MKGLQKILQIYKECFLFKTKKLRDVHFTSRTKWNKIVDQMHDTFKYRIFDKLLHDRNLQRHDSIYFQNCLDRQAARLPQCDASHYVYFMCTLCVFFSRSNDDYQFIYYYLLLISTVAEINGLFLIFFLLNHLAEPLICYGSLYQFLRDNLG